MSWNHWAFAVALLVSLPALSPLAAQERRGRIDVENYVVDAQIDPAAQTLHATVQVRFTPAEEINVASFELNNALNVSKVVDAAGRQIPASRSQQDFTIRLSFNEAQPKGKPATVSFTYDGRLTGEDSPVYGIKFAAVKSDVSYLMYPSRWIPVNEYPTDRFTAEFTPEHLLPAEREQLAHKCRRTLSSLEDLGDHRERWVLGLHAR